MNENRKLAFEKAGTQPHPNLVVEFFQMLKCYRKYWMIPLVITLLLLGLLAVLGSTSAAPFIYTLF